MTDDLANQLFPVHGEAVDPIALARRDMQKQLPRRFYKEAKAERGADGFVVRLDGKPAHTPGRQVMSVPHEALAQALAQEWNAQAEFIDPAQMPLTRMVNSALDGVAREMDQVRAEIVKYAGSDLICSRAGEPHSLVEEQARHWDPLLAFAHEQLGARFICAQGIIFAEQPAVALEAVAREIEGITSSLALAALHVMTTITGSVIIALALTRGHLTAEAAWAAAHVDEDFQTRAWGEDAEAMARRARRWRDMQAAEQLYRLA